jgi:predicted DNA-binding transcriptional regulator YafY
MAESPATTRARRLLTLLPFLRERRTISLAEIAAAVGSTEAEVAEDLTVLSMCGGDERDPNQLIGVFVEGDVAEVFAELPALERPVRLTPAEARALTAALQTIGIDPLAPLVRRLAEFAARSADLEDVATTVRASFAQGGQAAVIAALDLAAEKGVATRIAYASAESGEATARVVHPYALYRWRDAWYLLAHCETAGEQRTFRVDRIASVEMTPSRFRRPAEFEADASPLPHLDALPRATVRFASDAPDLSDRDWPGATFERAEDGSVTASVPYAGTAWIARRVAARLGDAEVLEPSGVRAAVVRTASAMLEALAG